MRTLSNFFRGGFDYLWNEPEGQIPALDGLRSFAILLVVVGHSAAGFRGAGGQDNFAAHLPFVQGGWIGVDLFFVLSGFFIGKQLWKEFSKTGSIHVTNFILRRGLRIWPLYYSVFLVTLVPYFLGYVAYKPIWPELFFVSNYLPDAWVGGSWSLATEEQFYISVPILIVLASGLTRSLSVLRWGVTALFLLAPVSRFFTWKFLGFSPLDKPNIITYLYYPIHTHCDGLLVGLIISNLITDGAKIKNALLRSPGFVLVIAAAAGAILHLISPIYFNYMGVALLFGSLVWFCLNTKNNVIVRFLSWKGFYLISKLSFGMYLMHQYALHMIAHGVLDFLPTLMPALQMSLVTVLNVILAMISAAVGVVLIEHPFLRLRGRLWFGKTHHGVAPVISLSG